MAWQSRIRVFSSKTARNDGRYVLYWMQQSQRTRYNHALEYATEEANRLGRPLMVAFCVAAYPQANVRHYAFMLQGIDEVRRELEKRHACFITRIGQPSDLISELAKPAALLITDRGYTPIQSRWRQDVCKNCDVPVIEVESDVVVPVDIASDKREYSAATLRRKITPLIDEYLLLPRQRSLKIAADAINEKSDDISLKNVTKKLHLDASVSPVDGFCGGYSQAEKRLTEFVSKKLRGYDELRNDPTKNFTSGLSAYMHFGQISPIEIALAVKTADAPKPDRDAFLEQLTVRRELAMNFLRFCQKADDYESLPGWARATLESHDKDRKKTYTLRQLEQASTVDEYWNAAQRQLVRTGTIHNYMRMYWGKKILEWAPSAKLGFEWCVHLNDRYALDGRDANSYAGIAWCFGNHDRPWSERPIYGNVRCMTAGGLERKFDIRSYAKMWSEP
ncbi:MAG TPA: deoxyribodipyrimidine photo-lyase [Phycisphaerae bacterium]|nr:deoxyribodipyrimidine photo-lyase [Phycisphaerae bacterium]HPS52444.1 deoxyribodipyrimidine photo-lyase [Phycisphaerae bacterium]